jgi:hypothetical protein
MGCPALGVWVDISKQPALPKIDQKSILIKNFDQKSKIKNQKSKIKNQKIINIKS